MDTERFYEKVRAISALSVDSADSDESRTLFDLVRNKLLYAVTGKTAAELINERVDVAKANMGLTSWRGAELCEDDVSVAENYLSKEEATNFDRLVASFLDYADDQARRRRQLFQHEWRGKLDAFLRLQDREILTGTGQADGAHAETHAKEQYALYRGRVTTPQ